MSNIAVKFENVSKYYKLYNSPKDRLKEALHPFGKRRHREFYALKNIDLEVHPGEIVGIVGKNGSGKSTLLKIIASVIPPNSGNAIVNGEVSALLELGTGLNPEYDGMQNILFGGIMMGYSKEEMKMKVDEIVSFADIGDFIYQPLKTYSSGMKARLGFALAISINPEILIVDEALAVGDELFRRKCYARMEEMFKSGCTVFYVSHSMSIVNEICTRAILMDNGELILDGSPKLVTMQCLKLMYANSNEKEELRNEILKLNKNEEEKKSYDTSIDPIPASPVSTPIPIPIPQKEQTPESTQINNPFPLPKPKEEKSEQKAFFIKNFTPKSTVIMKNEEITLGEFKIKTLDGIEVNSLVVNEEYIYSYTVEFDINTENVNFGMGIKNEKGVAISWMIYPGINKFMEKNFAKGEKYSIQWSFKCSLIPGNYFIDSGLRSLKNDEVKVLIKITDAFVFKVQDVENKQKGGYFDAIDSVEIVRIQ